MLAITFTITGSLIVAVIIILLAFVIREKIADYLKKWEDRQKRIAEGKDPDKEDPEPALSLPIEWYGEEINRGVFGVLVVIGILTTLILISHLAFSELGLPSYGWVLGLAAWVKLLNPLFRSLTLSVPEWAGAVTVSYISGEMRPYGTGLWFRYPWEQVDFDRFINTRKILLVFEEDYPSKNGVPVKVRGSIQYWPRLKDLGTYIGVNDAAITKGLEDILNAMVSKEVVVAETPENFREQFDRISKKIEEEFLGPATEGIEKKFAIEIDVVAFGDIKYDDDYQKALTTKQSMEKLKEAAMKVKEAAKEAATEDGEEVPFGDALDMVFVEHGKIDKSIISAGGKGAEAAWGMLAQVFGGRKPDDGKKKGKKPSTERSN